MSAGVEVALVIGLIFIIGITVGVIAVIALSAVSRHRRTDLTGPGQVADQQLIEHGQRSLGIPGHWDHTVPEEHQRWPD